MVKTLKIRFNEDWIYGSFRYEKGKKYDVDIDIVDIAKESNIKFDFCKKQVIPNEKEFIKKDVG